MSLSVFRTLVSFLILFALGACGGGGTPNEEPDPTENPNPVEDIPATLTIDGPAVVVEGDSVTLKVTSSNPDAQYAFVWSQQGGPTVELVIGELGEEVEFVAPTVSEDTQLSFIVRGGTEGEFSAFLETGFSGFGSFGGFGGVEASTATHSVLVENQFQLSDAPAQMTEMAFASMSSLLEHASLVRDLLQKQIPGSSAVTLEACENGGLLTSTHSDLDGDKSLSVYDEMVFEFADCALPPFNRPMNGVITLSLSAYEPETLGWEVVAGLNTAFTLSSFDLMTEMNIQYSVVDSVRSLNIHASEGSLPGVNQGLDFKQYSLTRLEHLNSAKYEINARAQLTDLSFDAVLDFETLDPFVGYFNEFPHSGDASLSIDSDMLLMSSNFVTDSSRYQIIGEEIEVSAPWSFSNRNILFTFGDFYQSAVRAHRVDNFSLVGQVGDDDDIKQLLEPVEFIFSRPIAFIESNGVEFRSNSSPYVNVPAIVTGDGARLIVTPSEPLNPGTQYSLPFIRVIGPFETAANSSSVSFTASDAIIPQITASSKFYQSGDTVSLTASASLLNRGSEKSYLWEEVTDTGALISDASAEQVDVTLVEGVSGAVVIRLTVSNEMGQSASTQVELLEFIDEPNVLAFASEPGDYIGGGATVVYSSVDGNFVSQSTLDNPNFIELRFDGGSNNWGLRIAAPNEEPLVVGSYPNATRYPFQSPTAPGLSFSGSGRGCNNSYSDFEILELSYNEEGDLSNIVIEFEQHCESPTAAPLSGLWRYSLE